MWEKQAKEKQALCQKCPLDGEHEEPADIWNTNMNTTVITVMILMFDKCHYWRWNWTEFRTHTHTHANCVWLRSQLCCCVYCWFHERRSSSLSSVCVCLNRTDVVFSHTDKQIKSELKLCECNYDGLFLIVLLRVWSGMKTDIWRLKPSRRLLALWISQWSKSQLHDCLHRLKM